MARKPKDTSHLRVRIDPIRLAKLESQAEKNGRTLTGEIVHRLDESFKSELDRRIEGLLLRDHAVKMLLSGDERAAILDKIAFHMAQLPDWQDNEKNLSDLAKSITNNILKYYL